jgi:hypothetical protein
VFLPDRVRERVCPGVQPVLDYLICTNIVFLTNIIANFGLRQDELKFISFR